MTRSPEPSRWVLLVLFLLCLGPACWNFLYITASAAIGYPLFPGARALPHTVMQDGLIFGSATLIGPIGLAAAFWTLSSPTHRPGTILMAVLWMLTVWAMYTLELPAQYPLLSHTGPGTQTFTVLLNLVLLPAAGVAQLHWLDVRRRRLVT